MPSSPLTRRKTLQLTAGLGIPALSGCIVDVDHILNYEPGAISVQNNDEQHHSVSVTLYKWDRSVWVENQKTPVEHDPEMPEEEPQVQRDFTFEVPPGRTEKKLREVTYPLCGILLIEVRLATEMPTSRRLLSRCSEDDPRSNLDIEVVIDNDGKIHVDKRTGQDD